ncbi:MAG: septation protein A [Chromatiaceae bacterium]|nr:septation protein A [Gammaproteobacteria bacterium]MCB1786084.1 septation protein A [Gammaproteobacteria bacterium]MCP5307118.1 septation protein A [Chromatiaceae bacterium]MCP5312301.1 septation protein A [Chromatiaceae bacterium]
MKMLADLFPVLLFFIAYQLFDIYVATQVAIAAAVLQVAYNKLRHGTVETMHWVTLGLLVVFGGLTLALRDPTFIKWKPTVVNWLFGAAFLVSQLFMERSLLRRMMDHAVSMPDSAWARLNMAWVAFFFVMGVINLYVAYNFPEDVWVNFKLFGFLGLTLLFMLAQGFFLARFIQTDTPTNED